MLSRKTCQQDKQANGRTLSIANHVMINIIKKTRNDKYYNKPRYDKYFFKIRLSLYMLN